MICSTDAALCVTGVRVDTWVETGTEISPFYDSLIGKLMVHASTRPEAIEKMLKALGGTRLGGIPSNLEYHSPNSVEALHPTHLR